MHACGYDGNIKWYDTETWLIIIFKFHAAMEVREQQQ